MIDQVNNGCLEGSIDDIGNARHIKEKVVSCGKVALKKFGRSPVRCENVAAQIGFFLKPYRANERDMLILFWGGICYGGRGFKEIAASDASILYIESDQTRVRTYKAFVKESGKLNEHDDLLKHANLFVGDVLGSGAVDESVRAIESSDFIKFSIDAACTVLAGFIIPLGGAVVGAILFTSGVLVALLIMASFSCAPATPVQQPVYPFGFSG